MFTTVLQSARFGRGKAFGKKVATGFAQQTLLQILTEIQCRPEKKCAVGQPSGEPRAIADAQRLP